MLVQVQGFARKRAHKAVQGQVEGGIVPLHGVQKRVDADVGGKFFPDFPYEGFLPALPRFLTLSLFRLFSKNRPLA